MVLGLLLPLAGAKRFRARLTAIPRLLLLLLCGGLSLGLLAGLGGCGTGGFLGTPKGQTSYTITISATSGTLVRQAPSNSTLSRRQRMGGDIMPGIRRMAVLGLGWHAHSRRAGAGQGGYRLLTASNPGGVQL